MCEKQLTSREVGPVVKGLGDITTRFGIYSPDKMESKRFQSKVAEFNCFFSER